MSYFHDLTYSVVYPESKQRFDGFFITGLPNVVHLGCEVYEINRWNKTERFIGIITNGLYETQPSCGMFHTYLVEYLKSGKWMFDL